MRLDFIVCGVGSLDANVGKTGNWKSKSNNSHFYRIFVEKFTDSMLTKERILHHLNDLPNEVSIDELMERIIFMYKIETALEQSKKGEGKPNTEIKKKYEKWLR